MIPSVYFSFPIVHSIWSNVGLAMSHEPDPVTRKPGTWNSHYMGPKRYDSGLSDVGKYIRNSIF